jgi:solute carrier family 25 carnitine/acylcarnitine transporter 20/29
VLSRGSNWSYFGGYEAARRLLTPPGSEGKLSPVSSILAGIVSDTYVHHLGACAGTSYWLSCYPIDVIKNRIQTQPIDKPLKYTSFTQCARSIYYEEGWRAFFKGFTPCLVRSLPANASAFFAFEVVYHMLP